MRTVSIDEQALFKVLLHAAKHTTSAVNGVLLGTASGGGADGAGAAALTATDAVPLCHSYTTLTPVLEAGLVQVEAHVAAQQQQQPGLRVVGYYQCNERLADGELGAGRRIADRVESAFPDSVAAVLDGAALQAAVRGQQDGAAQQAAGQEPAVLHVFCKDGARGWVRLPDGGSGGKAGARCPTQGVAARLAQYLAEGRHRQLADFEEHLDDIAADWLNPGLLQGPA